MKKSVLLSLTVLLAVVFSAFSVSAQSAVKWDASAKMTSKTEGVITVVGTIQDGYHVYGFNQSDDGPVSTSVAISAPKSVKFTGKLKYSPAPKSVLDDMFGVQVTYWENKVTFTRKFKIDKNAQNAEVTFAVTYMACNDNNCQPPTTENLLIKIK